MILHLIRHAQTFANEEGRYIGITDIPISEKGREKALRLAQDKGVQIVFVSPLLRARQTAEILFPDARQIIVDGLREMDFGTFEGKNATEMRDDADYVKWVDEGALSACPGGEGFNDVSARMADALMSIVKLATTEKLADVFVVTHGGSIIATMGRFSVAGADPFAFGVDNCCGYRITIDERTFFDNPVFGDIRTIGG